MRLSSTTSLLIDAIACFVGAILLFGAPEIWKWTDLPTNWREPVVWALLLFSILLIMAFSSESRLLLVLSVLGNIAWIIAGAIALTHTGTLLGVVIIALVMIGDAAMAWFQSRGIARLTMS